MQVLSLNHWHRLCFLMDGLKDLKYRSWSSPDVIKEKGLEHVTVDDLVAEITPKGRGKKMQTWMW